MDILTVHLDLLVQLTVVLVLVSTMFILLEQMWFLVSSLSLGMMYIWNISCSASMLELSRLIIDSGWVPSQPVIFLFNGAEELFLLVRDFNYHLNIRLYVQSLYMIHKWKIFFVPFLFCEKMSCDCLAEWYLKRSIQRCWFLIFCTLV